MRDLNCYARTCVHNDNCACKKNVINVENSQKKAECIDYEPIGATHYSYETASERSLGVTSHYSTDIRCKVNECQYNNNECCKANHVTINTNQIDEPGKVECDTFKRKNEY